MRIKEPIILKNLRNYDYDALVSNIKFYVFFLVIIIAVFMLATGIIQIWFYSSTQEFNFLFTIMNSLVFGAYFNLLGIFNTGVQRKSAKLAVLAIVLIIILLGFTFLNVSITFNFWFLYYRTYATASIEGVWFYVYNNLFWLIIYGASFLIESEVPA